MEINAGSPVINEGLRVRDETVIAKLRRRTVWLLYRLWLVARLSLILVPLTLVSLLLLDVPFRVFDVFVGNSSALAISNWLSRGDIFLCSTFFFLMLVTRSHGSVFAGRLVGLSWLLCAVFVGVMLIYLAPQLAPDDMPNRRFLTGFLVSWYLGQLMAVYVYDYTRGGNWWRAPLYGGVFGFAVQSGIYFPVVYAETGAPWITWMILDFAMKSVFCVLFLPIYYSMRRVFRPYLGSGTHS